MKNLSKQFRRALYNNERNYLTSATITLTDSTQLSLTNSEIWSGGFSYEEAVSQDDNFTALGAVVIGSATIIINNIYDTYSAYDFTDASVILTISMQFDSELETIEIGTYTVDEATYNGATIRLSLLDNMVKFDKPYSISQLQYPATLDEIVTDLCSQSVCDVTRATSSLNFPHKNYSISTRPNDESITCREVLSWVATLAGCFAKCNTDGELNLQWFDVNALDNFETTLDGGTFNPWSGGTNYNGGTFNPWSTGDVYDGGTLAGSSNVHYLYDLYSQNIGVDDVVITGVSITIKDEDENSSQNLLTFNSGTSGYVIQLNENPFFTKTNAQEIINWLGVQLIGLRFRKLDVSLSNDPSIESGDVAIVVDRKQNNYRALITRVSFSADGDEKVVCGASTPARNSANRYTEATKSYVETRKLLKQQKTTYDTAMEALSTAIAAKSGLYTTIESTQSGDIYYMHDKQYLAQSKVVWKMNSEAIAVTTNYNGQNPSATVWNFGVQVNGVVIAQIMNTIGINFSWGTGGVLTLGGADNVNGRLRMLNASGAQIGKWDKDGIDATGAFILKHSISNTLSVNGKIGSFKVPIPNYIPARTGYGLTLYNEGSDSANFNIATYIDNSSSNHVYLVSNKGMRFYSCITTPTSSAPSTGGALTLDSDGCLMIYESGSLVGVSVRSNEIELNAGGNGNFELNTSGVTLVGNLSVGGTKSRQIATPDYSDRLLYCYETPSPMFGDVGEGIIADDGLCYIPLDPIFAETINTSQYQVFLQKYGAGDCRILERKPTYFVVQGTPGMAFGWEIKAKQSDYEQLRLDKPREKVDISNAIDYGDDALQHIMEIRKEREEATA